MFAIVRTQLLQNTTPEVVAIRHLKERAIKRAKELAQIDLDANEPEEAAQSMNEWETIGNTTIQAMGDDGVISVYEVRHVVDTDAQDGQQYLECMRDVQSKYPDAHLNHTALGMEVWATIINDLIIIGSGMTELEAWQSALRFKLWN